MNPSPWEYIHVKLYWGIIMSVGGSCMNVLLTGGKLLSLETGSESGHLSVCQYGTDADRWLNVQSSADKGHNEES